MKAWRAAWIVAAASLAGCNPQDPYSHPAHDRWANAAGTPSDRTGGSRPVPVWRGRFPNNRVPEANSEAKPGKATSGGPIQ